MELLSTSRPTSAAFVNQAQIEELSEISSVVLKTDPGEQTLANALEDACAVENQINES